MNTMAGRTLDAGKVVKPELVSNPSGFITQASIIQAASTVAGNCVTV